MNAKYSKKTQSNHREKHLGCSFSCVFVSTKLVFRNANKSFMHRGFQNAEDRPCIVLYLQTHTKQEDLVCEHTLVMQEEL